MAGTQSISNNFLIAEIISQIWIPIKSHINLLIGRNYLKSTVRVWIVSFVSAPSENRTQECVNKEFEHCCVRYVRGGTGEK